MKAHTAKTQSAVGPESLIDNKRLDVLTPDQNYLVRQHLSQQWRHTIQRTIHKTQRIFIVVEKEGLVLYLYVHIRLEAQLVTKPRERHPQSYDSKE